MSDLTETEREELERLRAIVKKADWFWFADDPEYSFGDWWDILDGYDEGYVAEVWRGGVVEVAFCAYVGDEMVREATKELAEAKVKELRAKQVEDE